MEVHYARLLHRKEALHNKFVDLMAINIAGSKVHYGCGTITGNYQLFSFENQAIVAGYHVMSFHGFPAVEERLYEYSDDFLTTITSDGFFLPNFGCIQLALYINTHAPWWTRKGAAVAQSRSEPPVKRSRYSH